MFMHYIFITGNSVNIELDCHSNKWKKSAPKQK